MSKYENLDKTYTPSEIEGRLYKKWEESGYFKADASSEKPPYTIVIPPPNVTGQLHMGHALDETLQDILIRYKRLAGYEALWVPGTDHAGIATQIKVEEVLRKEKGLTRHDLGREEFLKLVWDWKKQYGGTIIKQLKTLGSSCDWSRERFTMDEGCSKAVKEVFVNLYDKGLIYRGDRIINWCPHCTTALSDAEVEYEEQEGNFWHIRYPFVDGSGEVIIATTRPETLLGDTAVAVHPEDERYFGLVGKMLVLPLTGREIPLIADEYVEKDFGTGAVKITPAHDPNDFEVGQRHDLPIIKILDDEARVNAEGGKYCGLDRYEAREQIVNDLKEQGYLVKIENHSHNVGTCYRCGTTVEPITSRQWFVKMKPLAEPAVDAVKNGDVKFVPERFSKTYLGWMENVRDWCISRQLWWGHRIPAYYCDHCGKMIVSKEDVLVCPDCGKEMWQDNDVLDTWFSSALWPFSTLGWPEKTADFEKFYPTNTLVTGYDIIFFWVARMVFSALEHTGKAPFEHVFIHGIVRDSQGRKMSKSLGNGVDPLLVIEKYGADALRFTLATGNSPGNDMRYYDERVQASANFANKIWNASRFVLMNLNVDDVTLPEADKLCIEDKWILNKYNKLVQEVTGNIDKFELGVAIAKLYDFIWDDFCDWYIELVKPRLYEDTNPTNETAQKVLAYVLTNTMILLHPFMPFITEEIWQHLPHDGETIMRATWPTYKDEFVFETEDKQMTMIMEAIKAIRNTRSNMNVPPSRKAKLYIKTTEKDIFELGENFFKKLASASEILFTDEEIKDNTVSVVTDGAVLYLPVGDLVDVEKERERLTKEKETLEAEVKRVQGKLNNPGFTAKAPAHLVEEERQKGIKYQEMLDKVLESLSKL